MGYQYPTPTTTPRGKHTVAYVVFGTAIILLVWAILASGRLPSLSFSLSVTNTSSSVTNSSIGSGSTPTNLIPTNISSTLSHVFTVVTKVLVGLVGFIASGTKLEVLAKSVVTAVVFWGLAYMTNLLKYLLYGLAVFSLLVGVLVVLGVV